MQTKVINKRILIAALVLCLAAIACSGIKIGSTGDLQTETQTVDLGSASAAKVSVKMQAGELDITGGAENLMQATFEYNVADWKPQVSYNVNGNLGELTIDQPGDDQLVGPNVVNTWNIQFASSVPLDLDIQTGAGQGTLDLSKLDITALQVATGAGNVNLDLSGSWNHDLNGTIDGGVGSLTINLPGDVGVRVEANTGLGNVSSTGLTKQGNTYVNQAYGSSPITISLDVTTGVGGIELKAP